MANNNYIEAVLPYQEALEKSLCELIAIPSVFAESEDPSCPYGKETIAALDYFLELARSFGFTTQVIDGRVGYVLWQGSLQDDYVASVCHLDVVPAGDWEEAFKPLITEDKIIGRGSVDDKGPALSVLYAMKALKDEGFVPRRSIRLILGLDEERGMTCLKHYNKLEKAPLASFTADADFPVIHAEKGICAYRIDFDFAKLMAVKTESEIKNSILHLTHIEAGAASNVIPGICKISYRVNEENLELVAEGKMGHASVPEAGVNAISKALNMLYQEAAKIGLSHPFLDFYQKYIKEETDGKSFGLAISDDVSGKLSFNVGLLSLNENKASLTIDIRYPVTASFEHIEAAFKNIEQDGIKAICEAHKAPLYIEKENKLVQNLLSAFNKVTVKIWNH